MEEARERWAISDRIIADADRQYWEAEKRKQAVYARIRAEQERRNKPLVRRIKEAIFG